MDESDHEPNDPSPEEIAALSEHIRENGFTGKDGIWRPAWGPKRYPGVVPADVVRVNEGDFDAAMRETMNQ